MTTILSDNYINFAVSSRDVRFSVNNLKSYDAMDTLKTKSCVIKFLFSNRETIGRFPNLKQISKRGKLVEILQFRTKFQTANMLCSRFISDCKFQSLRPATFFKKDTLAQVFSREICKISKNTFSYRTPPVDASGFGRAQARILRLPTFILLTHLKKVKHFI